MMAPEFAVMLACEKIPNRSDTYDAIETVEPAGVGDRPWPSISKQCRLWDCSRDSVEIRGV